MSKNLSWSVLLLIGLVALGISKLLGGVIGNSIGVLADILLLLGVVTGISNLFKKKS